MISLLCSLGRKSLALLAVLIVCLLPAAVRAESIKLTNTSTLPIVIEPVSSAGGTVYPGKPFGLNPGAKSAGIMLPGDKVIILRDKSGTRILQKIPVPASTEDQDYDIVLGADARGRPMWIIKPSSK
jgi:hypothetical protein